MRFKLFTLSLFSLESLLELQIKNESDDSNHNDSDLDVNEISFLSGFPPQKFLNFF